MLKKAIYLLLSIFFLEIKFIKSNLLRWGYGETFVGYLLEKIPYPFLKDFFFYVNPKEYIFVTGTNGKTSTVALLTHLLSSQSFVVYSNSSGSNLYRGVLSFFVLNYLKFLYKKPDFIILELDEGSVFKVLSNFPKNKSFSFILLNLSRDQLDRYGEVDLIACNIKKSLNVFNKNKISLIINPLIKDSYDFKSFKTFPLIEPSKKIVNLLDIKKYNHLKTNLSFVLSFLKLHSISLDFSKISAFPLVLGRGSVYNLSSGLVEVHLTKNPKSFDNNLLFLIKNKNSENILIVVNDFIPDGRDVSWFYDIDRNLLKKALKDKKVFVAGSRSLDFCNMLSIYDIPFINLGSYKYIPKLLNVLPSKNLFVFSNYSATLQIVRFLNNYVV